MQIVKSPEIVLMMGISFLLPELQHPKLLLHIINRHPYCTNDLMRSRTP